MINGKDDDDDMRMATGIFVWFCISLAAMFSFFALVKLFL
jgi:hypothetical protein